MIRLAAGFALAAALAAAPAGAIACPVCNTETGAAVRAGIFDDRLLATALAVIAPFPALALVVLGIGLGAFVDGIAFVPRPSRAPPQRRANLRRVT